MTILPLGHPFFAALYERHNENDPDAGQITSGDARANVAPVSRRAFDPIISYTQALFEAEED